MTDLATPPPVKVDAGGVVVYGDDFEPVATLDHTQALAVLNGLRSHEQFLRDRAGRAGLTDALRWLMGYVSDPSHGMPALDFSYDSDVPGWVLGVRVRDTDDLRAIADMHGIEPDDEPRYGNLSGHEHSRQLRINPFPGLVVIAHFERHEAEAEPEQVSA